MEQLPGKALPCHQPHLLLLLCRPAVAAAAAAASVAVCRPLEAGWTAHLVVAAARHPAAPAQVRKTRMQAQQSSAGQFLCVPAMRMQCMRIVCFNPNSVEGPMQLLSEQAHTLSSTARCSG
jgi:hypothetical protein